MVHCRFFASTMLGLPLRSNSAPKNLFIELHVVCDEYGRLLDVPRYRGEDSLECGTVLPRYLGGDAVHPGGILGNVNPSGLTMYSALSISWACSSASSQATCTSLG
jgi:hypothetical protein